LTAGSNSCGPRPADSGAPDWEVDAWVSTYTAIGSGVMAEVSPAIEDLTGVPPMDLETSLRANAG